MEIIMTLKGLVDKHGFNIRVAFDEQPPLPAFVIDGEDGTGHYFIHYDSGQAMSVKNNLDGFHLDSPTEYM